MKLNEKKRTAMGEALQQKNKEKWGEFHPVIACQPQRLVLDPEDIEEALTPFCMEMTDEEIKEVVAIKYGGSKHAYERGIELGFEIGIKFIRDGK